MSTLQDIYSLCVRHLDRQPASPTEAWEAFHWASYEGLIHLVPEDSLRVALDTLCLLVIRDSLGEGHVAGKRFFHEKLDDDVESSDLVSGKFTPRSEIDYLPDPDAKWYDEYFARVDYVVDLVNRRRKIRRDRSEQGAATNPRPAVELNSEGS